MAYGAMQPTKAFLAAWRARISASAAKRSSSPFLNFQLARQIPGYNKGTPFSRGPAASETCRQCVYSQSNICSKEATSRRTRLLCRHPRKSPQQINGEHSRPEFTCLWFSRFSAQLTCCAINIHHFWKQGKKKKTNSMKKNCGICQEKFVLSLSRTQEEHCRRLDRHGQVCTLPALEGSLWSSVKPHTRRPVYSYRNKRGDVTSPCKTTFAQVCNFWAKCSRSWRRAEKNWGPTAYRAANLSTGRIT